jgi:hypothetical protein
MSQDLRDIEPVTGLWMGAGFFLMGLFIVLVAVDWIHVDPGTIYAPRWVLGLCGGMFALTGVGILYYGLANALGHGAANRRGTPTRGLPVVSWLLGLVISGGLAVIASWVAFGPGERAFTGTVGVGGVGVGGTSSETTGRWVFGIGSVIVWSFFAWSLVYGLRRLTGRSVRSED